MYKVAVLVNENEVAHSAFANTPELLKKLSFLQEHNEDYYGFVVFDKFNIKELFLSDSCNFIMTFDSIFCFY